VLSIVLALGAACAYGLSDFLGGLVSRRASVWSVTLVTQIASLTFVGIAALGLPGRPTPADLAWGGVAGIGTGTGTVFLYRGLAAGRWAWWRPSRRSRRRCFRSRSACSPATAHRC
jgi:hypothetical protein